MTIERVSKLSVADFKRNFLGQERPVIITDAIDDWPARRLWSPEYMKANFGDLPINAGFQKEGRSETHDAPNDAIAPKCLGDYVDVLRTQSREGLWYLKQHPIRAFPDSFAKDFKKLSYLSGQMFLPGHTPYFWMGPPGAKAGLHFDYTHNFSVQISGRKKWRLYTRAQQKRLCVERPEGIRERVFGSGDYPHHSSIPWEADLLLSPEYDKADPIDFVVNPGEILFVPAEWPHAVSNLDEIISVNFFCLWLRWKDIKIGLSQSRKFVRHRLLK